MTARLMVLYNPPTDPAEFDRHYRDQHLPLVRQVPGIRAASLSVGEVGTPDGPAPYYRIGTFSWDTMADLQAGLGSPEGSAASADLPAFATGGLTMLVFEDEDVLTTG